jgi:hypothetical protein
VEGGAYLLVWRRGFLVGDCEGSGTVGSMGRLRVIL